MVPGEAAAVLITEPGRAPCSGPTLDYRRAFPVWLPQLLVENGVILVEYDPDKVPGP